MLATLFDSLLIARAVFRFEMSYVLNERPVFAAAVFMLNVFVLIKV